MASASGTAEGEVFDASKHRKPPSKFLSGAPRDAPAVRVGFVSPAIGYGLFAARDFAKDEFIFHEAPLMTARFNEKFSADKALMQDQVRAYRAAALAPSTRDVVALAFPRLAARTGVRPPPFDRAAEVLASASEMGRYLVHGRFAGSTVTRDQYESYTARLPVAANPSEAEVREACLDFFKHYAFEDLQAVIGNSSSTATATAAGVTRPAYIYLLGSLINHCCTPSPSGGSSSSSRTKNHKTSSSNSSSSSSSNRSSSSTPTPIPTDNDNGNDRDRDHDSGGPAAVPRRGPNCTWRIGPSGLAHFVRPRHILVQARRAIRAGEQLTWDYGKRDKGFACECETCREAGLFGLGATAGDLCGVL